jgi:hypothetical protein
LGIARPFEFLWYPGIQEGIDWIPLFLSQILGDGKFSKKGKANFEWISRRRFSLLIVCG